DALAGRLLRRGPDRRLADDRASRPGDPGGRRRNAPRARAATGVLTAERPTDGDSRSQSRDAGGARSECRCLAGVRRLACGGSALTAYDTIPYGSRPFAQTHPDRLATMATWFGLQPAPVEHCRVLELGCGSGANII